MYCYIYMQGASYSCLDFYRRFLSKMPVSLSSRVWNHFSFGSVFRGTVSSAWNTYPQEHSVGFGNPPPLVNTSTSLPHFGQILSSSTAVLLWLSQPSITAITFPSFSIRQDRQNNGLPLYICNLSIDLRKEEVSIRNCLPVEVFQRYQPDFPALLRLKKSIRKTALGDI